MIEMNGDECPNLWRLTQAVTCRHCKWTGAMKQTKEWRVHTSPESWEMLAGRDGWEYDRPRCGWTVAHHWISMS